MANYELRFTQITACNGTLYGLDRSGRVWARRVDGPDELLEGRWYGVGGEVDAVELKPNALKIAPGCM